MCSSQLMIESRLDNLTNRHLIMAYWINSATHTLPVLFRFIKVYVFSYKDEFNAHTHTQILFLIIIYEIHKRVFYVLATMRVGSSVYKRRVFCVRFHQCSDFDPPPSPKNLMLTSQRDSSRLRMLKIHRHKNTNSYKSAQSNFLYLLSDRRSETVDRKIDLWLLLKYIVRK